MAVRRDPSEEIRRYRFLVFGGFAALLTAVVLLSITWVSVLAYDVNWVVHGVDDATISCCPSFSESPAGELLTVYGTTAGVMFATEGDDGWTVSTVFGTQDASELITYSVYAVSMVIDADGQPHVASISRRCDELWTSLIYSEMTSSGWENTVVDTAASVNGVSIAVDSNSYAHISYAKRADWYFGYNLTYATDSFGEWDIYDISSQFAYKWLFPLVGSSIAVDSAGRPHIAFMTEYIACYTTNLTGTPVCEVVGLGTPSLGETLPSRPSILVDADDVVHILCFNECQEISDGPITRTVVHYSVSEGSGSYENTTIASDTDFSGAWTQTAIDADQGLHVFYRSADEIGVVTLTDGGVVTEDTIHVRDRETQGRWSVGISATLREDGEAVVSKPYGSVGYLTDSFTFVERLSSATESFHPRLIVLVMVVGVLSTAIVFSRKSYVEEVKWQEALKK